MLRYIDIVLPDSRKTFETKTKQSLEFSTLLCYNIFFASHKMENGCSNEKKKK